MIHFLKKTAPIGSQFCKPNHLGALYLAILFVQRFRPIWPQNDPFWVGQKFGRGFPASPGMGCRSAAFGSIFGKSWWFIFGAKPPRSVHNSANLTFNFFSASQYFSCKGFAPSDPKMTTFELGKNSAAASPPRRDGVPVGRFWLDFREKLMSHFRCKTAPIGSQFCKPNL